MPSKIRITNATSEDMSEVRKFRKEFDISIPEKRDSKMSQLLVARQGKELIGFMQLKNKGPSELQIRRLAVREKYRGNRVGRKLVAVARSIGINEGKKLITSSKPTSGANRFWGKHAKFSEVIDIEYNDFSLSQDYELDPTKEAKKRIRKAKGILKFLKLRPVKRTQNLRRK